MTDKRITELAARTSPTLEDLVEVAAEVGGSPTAYDNYKVRLAVLQALMGSGLAVVTAADAATTMLPNSLYVLDGAALSADRIFTLPASADCVVGQTRVGLLMTAGNASFEAIYKGNTSQSIDEGAGASEWSRVFITREGAIARYVATNKWIVEHDGRIAQKGVLRLSTSAAAEVAATNTRPTDKSGVWTADINVGSVCVVATGEIKTRRAGNFWAAVSGISANAVTDGSTFAVALGKTGVASFVTFVTCNAPATALLPVNPAPVLVPLAVDDSVVYVFRSSEGSRGLLALAAPRMDTSFRMTEIL